MSEVEQIVCADGFRVSARRFRVPAGVDVRGAALCVHAMMASSRYLDRPEGRGFAAALAAAGIETWTIDLRGHGGSAVAGGDVSFDDWVRLDLPAALAHVRQRARGPIGYIGHSLGGLVGTAGLGQMDAAVWPERLVLVATQLWTASAGGLGRRAIVEVWAGLTRLFGRLPAKALRFGSEDVPGPYSRQFVAWARSGRWLARDGVDYGAGAARLSMPRLVVTGGRDRLCPPHEGERFARRLAGARAEAIELPWADHFTLFTDQRARPVWTRIAEFVANG